MIKYKVGDLIECISTSNGTLTIGKKYKIIGIGNTFFTIKNNGGLIGEYFKRRFEPFKKEKRFENYAEFKRWNES